MISRYLRTGGAVGSIPLWYRLVRAAKWAGVSPWELADEQYFWFSAIEESMIVEDRMKASQKK